MRITKQRISLLSFFCFAVFTAGYALADDSVVTPGQFLDQALNAIREYGGLPWMMKVSVMVLLVVASMKVSFLKALVWNRLGAAQVWLAPFLGLIGGILSLGAQGAHITFSAVLAYLSAGAGAIILHELLDSLKAIPGLGPVYIGLIDAAERALGGQS